jgi:uncharacterized protein YndB with AHSA1/START domain
MPVGDIPSFADHNPLTPSPRVILDALFRLVGKARKGRQMRIELETKITINAPALRVWEALTTPEIIKQWFFGVDTTTDWKVGSPIIHRGEYLGRPYEDKGIILTFEPPRQLVHSHWSPVSGLPDSPENYQRVSWSLAERDGEIELTIAEENLPSDEAKSVSEQGWNMVLLALKELLER